jgi:peptide-methionine (S)-S-oxide reductase
VTSNGHHRHQQYLSDAKNPYGYCNHGPNGMTCPVGVARTYLT